MVIFMDSDGIGDFRLRKTVIVGPIMSRINGIDVFTATMETEEIRDLSGWEYQQAQIQGPN